MKHDPTDDAISVTHVVIIAPARRVGMNEDERIAHSLYWYHKYRQTADVTGRAVTPRA